MAAIPELKKEHLIAGGVGLAVCIALVVMYVYKPTLKKIEVIQVELQEKESKLREAESISKRLDQLKRDLAAVEVAVKEAERQLPRDKEVPGLLRIVAKLAEQVKINVSNFTPMGVQSQAYFNEVPFNLSVTANYHNLGLFFAEIAQVERIMNVRNLSMNVKTPTLEDPTGVSASFTIVTYTFKGG